MPLQPISPFVETDSGEIVEGQTGSVAGGGGGDDDEGAPPGGDFLENPEDAEGAPPSDIVVEAEIPKPARDPGQPSKADRAAHKLTHCPYRSWCEHCVRGQAVGRPHRSVPDELSKSDVPRVIIDYAFLQQDMTQEVEGEGEEGEGGSDGARATMKVAVMIETECESIWAYVVESKGTLTEQWLAPKMCEDLATVGLGKARILVKTDQEPAIVDLQNAIAKCRSDTGTALECSRVGDSNSNGKIERAIRKLKGLVRTLRSDIEGELKMKMSLESPIVPWLVRHAAYILTRSEVKEDGKTALQKMKGRRSNGVLFALGEAVMFKIPNHNVKIGDFEDRFEEGIWVGLTVRSGEHIVATQDGTYRTGAVMKRPLDRQWSEDLVKAIRGSPKEPKPGVDGSRIPMFVKYKDQPKMSAKYEVRAQPEADVRQLYIYKKDVDEHGATDDCRACASLGKNGHARGYTHTGDCRLRFEELLQGTEGGKRRLQRADDRLNEEVLRRSEVEGAGSKDIAEESAVAGEAEEAAPGAPMDTETEAVPGGAGDDAFEGSAAQATGRGMASRLRAEAVARGVLPPQRDEFGRIAKGEKRAADVQITADDPVDTIEIGLLMHDAICKEIVGGTHGTWELTEEAYRVAQLLQSRNNSVVICDEIHNKRVAPAPINSKIIASPTNPLFSLKAHPGPIVQEKNIVKGDVQWQDIGSGTFAKTFRNETRLRTTSQHGPPIGDVHRRTVWSLSTGKVIDDCIPDDVSDEVLHRQMGYTDNIRVELVMKDALAMYHRIGSDVSEIYSQPRVTQEAAVHTFQGQKLQPGWSLDLTRNDPKTGASWDLGCRQVQDRVRKMVMQDKPLFLIGSPPCTPFSTLQNISKYKRDPKIVAEERRVGLVHLEFCMSLYVLQIAGSRFFIHEHPSRATSWEEKEVLKVAAMEGVGIAEVDMCCYGMRVETGPVQGIAKKPTKILSNSAEVLKRIPAKCPNDVPGSDIRHNHVKLESGKAKRCQIYPREFCFRICEGIAAEKRLRVLGLKSVPLMSVEDCKASD